jgi:hypothetical protein
LARNGAPAQRRQLLNTYGDFADASGNRGTDEDSAIVLLEGSEEPALSRTFQRDDYADKRKAKIRSGTKVVPGPGPTEDPASQRHLMPSLIPGTALTAAPDRRPVPAVTTHTLLHLEPARGQRFPVVIIRSGSAQSALPTRDNILINRLISTLGRS